MPASRKTSPVALAEPAVPAETLTRFYEDMLLIRRFVRRTESPVPSFTLSGWTCDGTRRT